MLASVGATQIEPGHGLTGTTPLHVFEDLPETPAVVYLSEVSHLIGDEAFCFGGGLYIDPVFPDYPVRAIVSREPTASAKALKAVEIPGPAAIDYYGMIAERRARARASATAWCSASGRKLSSPAPIRSACRACRAASSEVEDVPTLSAASRIGRCDGPGRCRCAASRRLSAASSRSRISTSTCVPARSSRWWATTALASRR